jgi:hypothetical protein
MVTMRPGRGRGILAAAVFFAAVAWGLSGCASKPEPPPQLVPKSVELSSNAVEVPMPPTRSGVPIVPVRLEGGATADMLLDTGAVFAIVSHELVSRGNLPVRTPAGLALADAGSNVRKASAVARVGKLCLVQPTGAAGIPGAVPGAGAICFGSFDAFVTDLAALSRGPGQRVDGMLGLPLFREVLLTVDYPRARLRVERGELPAPDGQEVLPMQLASGGRLLVPLRIGGREVWANMDTGFAGGMVIPDWAIPSFPGAERAVEGGDRFRFIAGVSERARIARLTDDMRIGRHVVRRPVVHVGKVDEPTIGTAYLLHFAITLDQKNKRVRFARLKAGAIEVPPVYRPGFEINPATGVVTYVLPGGRAAGAGLRVGDRITALGGVPFADFLRNGPAAVARAAAGGSGRVNEFSLDVDRGGAPQHFNIPLTVVVP